MKVRYIDERTNENILSKKYYFKSINDDMFTGYMGVIDIYDVAKKQFVPRDNRKSDCILDAGYKRLRIFPSDKNFAINAIYDSNLRFVEFYIDIIRDVKLENKTNVPYMEDLYLDVVYTNKDEIIVLDEDELQEALDNDFITEDEFILATKAKDQVVDMLSSKEKANSLVDYCNINISNMLSFLNRKE